MHYCSSAMLNIAIYEGFYDDNKIEMLFDFNHDEIGLDDSFLLTN